MDKSYRIGAIAVIGAVLLRLSSGTIPQKAAAALSDPEVARVILFAETGRWVQLPQSQTTHQTESSPPQLASSETPLCFTQEDAQLVEIQNAAALTVDIPALMQQELNWDLTADQPTVLILHTHTSESYTYTGGYVEDTAYRTLDQDYNMVSIGQALAEELEKAGICVLHDQTVHDYPSYNGSYVHSRTAVSSYLEQYPSIRLVLDLHRDAMEDSSGNQVAVKCSVGEQEAAKLMLVIGANHDGWEENMALAVKLQARLEQLYPGICRPIAFRAQRFNQDLSDGALLIEVGAAGNTRQQALYSVKLLSQAIIDLQNGTVPMD